jgi:hypothetical protein
MKFILRKLRIHSLRTNLTIRRVECQALARQFDAPHFTTEEQEFIKTRWGNLMQEIRSLQIELDQILAGSPLS